ncbi:hypothetical protein ACFL2Q_14005, partial [Thermodesulfobacteriota bacterium]
VALAYARIYAGGIIVGINGYKNRPPVEALQSLRDLKRSGLIGWHYRVPTEALMAAEALALNHKYQKGGPRQRLGVLREMAQEGLISKLTKKELEKLPAWRALTRNPEFLREDSAKKKKRILRLKAERLITPATSSDLISTFKLNPLASPLAPKPTLVPKGLSPPAN